MSAQPQIHYMVELSTGHLPYEICRSLADYDAVIAYPLTAGADSFGWLLPVPDHQQPTDPDRQLPAELVAIYRYARLIGCTYILLDRDANTIADLPLWDW